MFSIKAASPQFDQGNKKSPVIRSGMNNVHLVTEVLVENRYLAAQLFSKMISKEPIHIEMKYKAVVSLQPIFIIPIELPINGEVFFCNLWPLSLSCQVEFPLSQPTRDFVNEYDVNGFCQPQFLRRQSR